MGWDIQINPTAEAFPISTELVELIHEWAVDFEMKYCFIEHDPRVVALLRTYRARDQNETRVVEQLLRGPEQDETVELLLGH